MLILSNIHESHFPNLYSDQILIVIKSVSQIIICDTDLLTIKIWSEYKFGKCDSWILDKINTQKKEQRIYLLCKPDLMWEYDPQRENEYERDKIFNLYKKELISLEHKFWIIKGNNRLDLAKKYIASIF